jgi:hypothetical protein
MDFQLPNRDKTSVSHQAGPIYQYMQFRIRRGLSQFF